MTVFESEMDDYQAEVGECQEKRVEIREAVGFLGL